MCLHAVAWSVLRLRDDPPFHPLRAPGPNLPLLPSIATGFDTNPPTGLKPNPPASGRVQGRVCFDTICRDLAWPLTFDPSSSERDLGAEGPVLPRAGVGPLHPAHPKEHHQADLLLQPCGQGLGEEVWSLPVLWLWYVCLRAPSLLTPLDSISAPPVSVCLPDSLLISAVDLKCLRMGGEGTVLLWSGGNDLKYFIFSQYTGEIYRNVCHICELFYDMLIIMIIITV